MIDNLSFKINGTEYFFGEITLRKFYVLQELIRLESPDSEFKVAELVTGAPVEMLKKLKYQDWVLIWINVQKTIQSINTTTNLIQPTIKFQDVEYALPKVDEMTAGEFIDLDIIFASPNSEKKLNEIAAILYRPIKERRGNYLILEAYDSSEAQARAEIFQDLSMSAIRSANSFFTQSTDSLLKNTLGSLELTSLWKDLSPEDQELLRNSLQQGIGGSSSTKQLEIILSTLIQSPDSISEASSTGWLGRKMKSVKQIFNRKKYLVNS
jgi:hypothetical protein